MGSLDNVGTTVPFQVKSPLCPLWLVLWPTGISSSSIHRTRFRHECVANVEGNLRYLKFILCLQGRSRHDTLVTGFGV
ncbi:hypothetical protein P691DRAFT_451468 [Macrolepiota fuliginosa MF-IS2]|uniref:Uncharacterized protein n=1 Tax=Macrolepiota fuliginosa MF-IS2 TaxID=1400762 RepID=A0A9P6C6Y6_9AGAR|nr:hypothetical protein P691DRAFT_451468 [Macrolepiota fuliginosa MF-IS2]